MLAECAVTRVASRSTTSGVVASIPVCGALSPANSPTRAPATARAVLIAVNAAEASLANASTVRETAEPRRPARAAPAQRVATRYRPGGRTRPHGDRHAGQRHLSVFRHTIVHRVAKSTRAALPPRADWLWA